MTVKRNGTWKQTDETTYEENLYLSDTPNQIFTEDLDDVLEIYC